MVKRLYPKKFIIKIIYFFLLHKSIKKILKFFNINKATLFYWCQWYSLYIVTNKNTRKKNTKRFLKQKIIWNKLKTKTPFLKNIFFTIFYNIKQTLHKNICVYFLKKNYSYKLFIKKFLIKEYFIKKTKHFVIILNKKTVCKYKLLNFFFFLNEEFLLCV